MSKKNDKTLHQPLAADNEIVVSDAVMADLIALINAGDDFNKAADILDTTAAEVEAFAELLGCQDDPEIKKFIEVVRKREDAKKSSPQP